MLTSIGLSVLLFAVQSTSSQFAWAWDAEAGTCGYRQHSSGRNILRISSTPGSDRGMTISVEVPRKPSEDDWEPLQQVQLAFEPGGSGIASAHIFPGRDLKSRDIRVGLGEDGRRRFRNAKAISISHPQIAPITVPVNSGPAVLDAMTRCEDVSMRKWGIDPLAWRSLQSPPEPAENPSSWITFNDLPVAAIRSRVGADLITRLQVDQNGRVVDCTVVEPRNARGFRENVCRVFRLRGKFAPARNTQGQPVAAPYMTVVRYKFQ